MRMMGWKGENDGMEDDERMVKIEKSGNQESR